MLKHASWVHGNAVVVEDPGSVTLRHVGMGTEMFFKFALGGRPTGTWCHIPIPTPVIINDVRLKVQTLFLMFQTGQHAAIDNVHIFDGPSRIAMFDAAIGSGGAGRREGNHLQSIDAANTITLQAPHEVIFGMSISFTFRPVAVTTTLPGGDPEGRILISSAGADFI